MYPSAWKKEICIWSIHSILHPSLLLTIQPYTHAPLVPKLQRGIMQLTQLCSCNIQHTAVLLHKKTREYKHLFFILITQISDKAIALTSDFNFAYGSQYISGQLQLKATENKFSPSLEFRLLFTCGNFLLCGFYIHEYKYINIYKHIFLRDAHCRRP